MMAMTTSSSTSVKPRCNPCAKHPPRTARNILISAADGIREYSVKKSVPMTRIVGD